MTDIEKRRADRWNFLFIAGMWFQDLFNYDFRRTEMCIIPYGTQQGEISFCAYNTGIGWRNILEKMHMTATLTKWYEEHGRHEIFAGNKNVPLADQGALADPQRRGRGRRRADRPRRPGHRQERARREAGRAQEVEHDARGNQGSTWRWSGSTGSRCSRSSRRSRSRALAARRSRTSRKSRTRTSCSRGRLQVAQGRLKPAPTKTRGPAIHIAGPASLPALPALPRRRRGRITCPAAARCGCRASATSSRPGKSSWPRRRTPSRR